MWDYEKSSVVTYPFYFINWQPVHKTSCMQRIKKILIWEVLPTIALKIRVVIKSKVYSYFLTKIDTVGASWHEFLDYQNITLDWMTRK